MSPPLQDAQFIELKHSKWEKYIGENYGKPNAKEESVYFAATMSSFLLFSAAASRVFLANS